MFMGAVAAPIAACCVVVPVFDCVMHLRGASTRTI